MDNSKYIEALDELMVYYRCRIEQLEQMKLDALQKNMNTDVTDDYETTYYNGCLAVEGDNPDIKSIHYDPYLNRTVIKWRKHNDPSSILKEGEPRHDPL